MDRTLPSDWNPPVPPPDGARSRRRRSEATQGSVWLRRLASDGEAEPPNRLLVVPMGGKPTFEVGVPSGFFPAAIGDGRLVGVAQGEFDVQFVDVYAYDPPMGLNRD